MKRGKDAEYKWRPIEDIPEELYTYSDPDLRALEMEWQEVRARHPMSLRKDPY